jgi:hypothetical protein
MLVAGSVMGDVIASTVGRVLDLDLEAEECDEKYLM